MTLREGYAKSSCDCMECSILENNFPFVARTNQINNDEFGLDATLETDLMFFAWFLDVSKQHQKVRLCPDILYLTYEAKIGTSK